MHDPEYQYLYLLRDLRFKSDEVTSDHLQRGPQAVPAVNLGLTRMTFDLSDGTIPLLTTKKVSFKNVVVELLWFLSGESRLDYMHKHNVHFWDDWASEEVADQYGLKAGDVGRIYGPNWIRWPTTDGKFINQIQWIINGLKEHPEWRRWKATAWNPEFLDQAFLAPCHGDIHLIMVDGKLELHHFQRSGDLFLGVPYNIASYAILLRMIGQVTGLPVGKLEQITSDTHFYINHKDAADEQLIRIPRGFPKLLLDPDVHDLFAFRWPDHFALEGYAPYPHIGAEASL